MDNLATLGQRLRQPERDDLVAAQPPRRGTAPRAYAGKDVRVKPLSNRQKAVLAQAAARAFKKLSDSGQLGGVDLDTWRRDECERAVGKPGLRECDNGDYLKLLAAFESLAGEDGRAMNALVKEQSESRRRNEFILVREMERGGFGPAYVETICRSQFKCAVADATADQLLKLAFTIRNRSAARRRKAESPAPEPVSTS